MSRTSMRVWRNTLAAALMGSLAGCCCPAPSRTAGSTCSDAACGSLAGGRHSSPYPADSSDGSGAAGGSRAGGCFPMPFLILPGCFHLQRTMAVPEVMPLGSITRAHWHMQETNGEASDFVIHRNEFVDNSSELSPYGRDHILEIAARMPSAPFPVIVQRSMNNNDPELDQIRRELVVRVLCDLGNVDAEQRVIVSQPYSDGINSMEGEFDYGRFRGSRTFGNGFGGAGGGGFSGGF